MSGKLGFCLICRAATPNATDGRASICGSCLREARPGSSAKSAMGYLGAHPQLRAGGVSPARPRPELLRECIEAFLSLASIPALLWLAEILHG